jgi:hypothetical protein
VAAAASTISAVPCACERAWPAVRAHAPAVVFVGSDLMGPFPCPSTPQDSATTEYNTKIATGSCGYGDIDPKLW